VRAVPVLTLTFPTRNRQPARAGAAPEPPIGDSPVMGLPRDPNVPAPTFVEEEWDQHENASPKSMLWLSRRLLQTEFLALSSPGRIETSYTNEIARKLNAPRAEAKDLNLSDAR
jgi:hypothetical protein